MTRDAECFCDLLRAMVTRINELQDFRINLNRLIGHGFIHDENLMRLLCTGIRFLEFLSQLLSRFFRQLRAAHL